MLKIGLVLFFIALVNTEDNLVQISLKRVNNVIDDRFISYSMDSVFLKKQLSISGHRMNLTKALSPGYVKISDEILLNYVAENTVSNNLIEPNKNNWESLANWLRTNDLIPVIVLAYNSNSWEPKKALTYLNLVDKWNINNCIWQLGGEDFNNTNIRKYVNDIKVLKTMINTFADKKQFWKIVATKTNSPNDNYDEMKLFYDLVPSTIAAVSWSQSDQGSITFHSDSFAERESLLRFFSRASIPTWLTLKSPAASQSLKRSSCDQACILDGLTWANILGQSSKHGFDVIFKPLDDQTFANTNLEYYISKLFKNIVHKKVFDVKVLTGDRGVNFYSFCSKNISGGLTMMAINTADEQMKITTKIGFRNAGTEIMQYILTISDGNILLNNEKLMQDTLIDPFIKFKRLHRPLVLNLPPYSVGFFIFPRAGIVECMDDDYEDESEDDSERVNILSKVKTSSHDRLLEQLIKENLKKDQNGNNELMKSRTKRSIIPKKVIKNRSVLMTKRELNRLKRYIVGKKLYLFPKITKNFGRKFKKPLLKTLTRKRRQLDGNKRLERFQKLKMLTQSALTKNILTPLALTQKPSTIVQNSPKILEDEGQDIVAKHSENINIPRHDVFYKIKNANQNSESVEAAAHEDMQQAAESEAEETDANESMSDIELEKLKHYARFELPEEIIQYLLTKKSRSGKGNSPAALPAHNHESVEELNIYGSLMDTIDMSAANKTPVSDVPEDHEEMESQHQYYVLKQLEPTAKQNLENLLKAKMKLKTFYVKEAANGSTEYEVEESKESLTEEDDINDDGFFSAEDSPKKTNELPAPKDIIVAAKSLANNSNVNWDWDHLGEDVDSENPELPAASVKNGDNHEQLIEGLYQLIDILSADKKNQRKRLSQDKILIKRAANYLNEDKQKKKMELSSKQKYKYDAKLEENGNVLIKAYGVERIGNRIVRKNSHTMRLKDEGMQEPNINLNSSTESEGTADELNVTAELENNNGMIVSTEFNNQVNGSLSSDADENKQIVQNVIKLVSNSFDKCIKSFHESVSNWFNYFQS